jgi:hypothetical protein
MQSHFVTEKLGEPAVYLGHPLTLALLIINKYKDFASASNMGSQFPVALEDCDIPGAGGEVYAALDLLRSIQNGTPVEKAVDDCMAHWKLYNAGGHLDRVQPADIQAKVLRPKFMAAIAVWVNSTE